MGTQIPGIKVLIAAQLGVVATRMTDQDGVVEFGDLQKSNLTLQ